VLYGEVNNVENLLVTFDSFIWSDVLLTVHTIAHRHLIAIYLGVTVWVCCFCS
jgi:hypothetical protein